MNALLLGKNAATAVRLGMVAFVLLGLSTLDVRGSSELRGLLAAVHVALSVGLLVWGLRQRAAQRDSLRGDVMVMLAQISGPLSLVGLFAPAAIATAAVTWAVPIVWLGLFEGRFKAAP